MKVVAIGGLEIFLQAYFVTIHSAQCIQKDWSRGTENRYNPAALEGLDLIDAL